METYRCQLESSLDLFIIRNSTLPVSKKYNTITVVIYLQQEFRTSEMQGFQVLEIFHKHKRRSKTILRKYWKYLILYNLIFCTSNPKLKHSFNIKEEKCHLFYWLLLKVFEYLLQQDLTLKLDDERNYQWTQFILYQI